MKKLIIAAFIALALTSCTKHGEQIEVAKNKMKSWNISEKDIDGYTFVTAEISDKEMYSKLSGKYLAKSNEYKDSDLDAAAFALKKAGEFTDMIGKASDKRFYIVKATAVAAGDTIHKKIFYIDDKNEIIDMDNLK